MRIRYRYARSLLAGFLAVVLLFSLVPAASAAQQNSYDENGTRRQDIEIYYSFVGKIDLPEA